MSRRPNGSRGVSRRAFIQGVGVTMSLPWLESLAGSNSGYALAEGSTAASAAAAHPKRFAVMFMANGVSPDHWWAKEAEGGLQLGKCLESLEPLKSKVNVIHGLF